MPLAELRQVADGVYELGLPIPFENGRVNAFVMPSRGGVDLVDCGMNSPESIDLVRGAVRELGGGASLRRLVVTHIHPDHYGAAGILTNEDGAELYLHRLEIPLVHPRYRELEQLVAEVGRHLEINGVPEADAEQMQNVSRRLRDFVTPAQDPIQLDGAETLDLGERSFRVLWTPGHSPGHIVLFDPVDRLLLGGDQLLPEMSPNIGLHPQSTPNPLDEYLEANRLLAALMPRLVLPAHGSPFNDAAAKVEHLAEHHRRRKERILEIVHGRQVSAWEVAVELWGNRQHLYEKRLALQEALAHLQSLAVDGRLEKRVTATSVRWRRPG